MIAEIRKYAMIRKPRRICMRFALFFSAFCLLQARSLAEDAFRAILPEAEAVSQKEEFTWNKWETDNFIILSIEKNQGLELKRALESARHSYFDKWGLERPDSSAKVKCKVMCVPDGEMLKRFFGIDHPRAEVRTEGSGLTCAIWMDFKSLNQLPALVALICSSEEISGLHTRCFVRRGISMLSLPTEKVRSELPGAGGIKFIDISSCGSDKWNTMPANEKLSFDQKSALVCLFFRKEFGQEKFLKFLSSPQDEDSVLSIYGFRDSKELDDTLNRYFENLKRDIESGITPDSYLTVKGAEK